MKKNVMLIILMSCIILTLFAELDFCCKTIIVVLEPSISHYTGTVDASFFGSFEKVSVENIFRIHNENAIQSLNSRSPKEFRSIYLITLPTDDKSNVLKVIEELKTVTGG